MQLSARQKLLMLTMTIVLNVTAEPRDYQGKRVNLPYRPSTRCNHSYKLVLEPNLLFTLHLVNLGSWDGIGKFLSSIVLLIRPETIPSAVRYGTVL